MMYKELMHYRKKNLPVSRETWLDSGQERGIEVSLRTLAPLGKRVYGWHLICGSKAPTDWLICYTADLPPKLPWWLLNFWFPSDWRKAVAAGVCQLPPSHHDCSSVPSSVFTLIDFHNTGMSQGHTTAITSFPVLKSSLL